MNEPSFHVYLLDLLFVKTDDEKTPSSNEDENRNKSEENTSKVPHLTSLAVSDIVVIK